MSDESRGQENEPTLRKSCGPNAAEARAQRRRSAGLVGIFAAAGAALLSTSCFWLPVVLVAGGASAAGTAGAVDALRIPLLAATGVLLVAGFYFLYIRTPRSECTPGQRRMQRVSRAGLWVGAAVAIAFAAFPDQITGAFTSSRAAAASIDGDEDGAKTYELDGMHSPACVGVAEDILAEIPGVGSTAVYYEEEEVILSPHEGDEIDEADVFEALEDSPFEASPLSR